MVLLGDDPGRLPLPELVARILNWVEAPMDLDDLVNGLTELLGKKDRQYG